MAGHSHWKQIKIKKKAEDQKRGEMFSKLLKAVAAFSVNEPNPQFNPRLRAAILQAQKYHVPQEKIERAIKRTEADHKNLEDLILEAYGPGGVAILISAISNNRFRTINEIKHLLKENGAKWAESGSVRWCFEFNQNQTEWQPKFFQPLNEEEKKRLQDLIEILENHPDVFKVFTNASID